VIARLPQVAAALAELGVSVDGDDVATGWAVAVGTAAADSYERAALRSLSLALAAGDAARAIRAARWVTDPSGAMTAALSAM